MTKKTTRAQLLQELAARAQAIIKLNAEASKTALQLTTVTERRDQLEQDFAGVETRLEAAVGRRTHHLQSQLDQMNPRIQQAIAAHTSQRSREIEALKDRAEADRDKINLLTSRNQSLLAQVGQLSSELATKERAIRKLKAKAAPPVADYAWQPMRVGMPSHLL